MGEAARQRALTQFGWQHIVKAYENLWQSQEEEIKFFACAYNYSYWKPKKEIDSFVLKKFFYAGFSVASTKYCYADIAWYYFQQP